MVLERHALEISAGERTIGSIVPRGRIMTIMIGEDHWERNIPTTDKPVWGIELTGGRFGGRDAPPHLIACNFSSRIFSIQQLPLFK